MNILYGTPYNPDRATLNEIPFDSIINKIQRLAMIRKEELEGTLKYGSPSNEDELEKELKTICNILDNIHEPETY